jgi:hypothetical protein
MASSGLVTHCLEKGYSPHRLAAAISVCQKTAWFMLHRIRAALNAGSFEAPLSGEVEADTTGVGGKEGNKHASKRLHRGTGNVGKAVVFGCSRVTARCVPRRCATKAARRRIHSFARMWSRARTCSRMRLARSAMGYKTSTRARSNQSCRRVCARQHVYQWHREFLEPVQAHDLRHSPFRDVVAA